jgi:hypothetical protein
MGEKQYRKRNERNCSFCPEFVFSLIAAFLITCILEPQLDPQITEREHNNG